MLQGLQAPQTASLQILPYATAAATLEQLSQAFMLETSDRVITVTYLATMSTKLLQATNNGEEDS
jgi:hypothetical protein